MADKDPGTGTIAQNRRARHDYFIDERFEAGLALMGWEVKSLRAGRLQLNEGYVMMKNEEAWLHGAHISPLNSASTHVIADPTRTRKLLLKRREVSRLIGQTQRDGMTLIPLAIYFNPRGIAKLQLGLAHGKRKVDKRAAEKERDWKRDKARLLRTRSKE